MSMNHMLARGATIREVCLNCADIPAVKSRIDLLLPALEEDFDDNLQQTLLNLAIEIDDIAVAGDDDAGLLVGILWLALLADFASMDPEVVQAVGLSSRALVRSGAVAAGGAAPVGVALRTAAAQGMPDLRFWMARVVDTPAIEASIKAALRGFIRRRDFSVAARRALLENVKQTLLLGRRSILPTLDAWAYRWFNIGSFNALTTADGPLTETLVAVNNPPSGPDSVTTPFCRWVHGQVVEVRAIRRQIQSYLSAITVGRAEEAKEAWPLLSGPEARGESGEFETLFSRLSLPPYHWRCRTVIRRTLSE